MVVTSGTVCLTSPRHSVEETQDEAPRCVFSQEVQAETEESRNLDLRPQGSL